MSLMRSQSFSGKQVVYAFTALWWNACVNVTCWMCQGVISLDAHVQQELLKRVCIYCHAHSKIHTSIYVDQQYAVKVTTQNTFRKIIEQEQSATRRVVNLWISLNHLWYSLSRKADECLNWWIWLNYLHVDQWTITVVSAAALRNIAVYVIYDVDLR